MNGYWNYLATVDWAKVAPLLAVIGGLCSFILYKRRQWSLEIERLKLEIARMRREESLIQRPTLKEMREIFEATRSFEKKGRLVGDDLGRFGTNLRHYLVYLRLYYNDPIMKEEIERQRKWSTKEQYPIILHYPEGPRPDPTPVYREWSSIKEQARLQLPPETFEEIDSLLRYLVKEEKSINPTLSTGEDGA